MTEKNCWLGVFTSHGTGVRKVDEDRYFKDLIMISISNASPNKINMKFSAA
jgi:hypothetical protein